MSKVSEKFRDVTEKAVQSMKTIEDVKKELKEVPTRELVAGFIKVKDFHKKVKSFTEAVRDEIKDSRMFNDENSRIDSKGHGYLEFPEGTLKSERRVSAKLNEERAKKFLKENGILGVLESEYVLKMGSEDVKIFGAIVHALRRLDDVPTELIDWVEDLRDSIEVTERVNEEKLEATYTLGEIEEMEFLDLYDLKETYALKEVKKK